MMQRPVFLRLAAAAALALCLASCGPMYDTQYHFIPPADAAGRQMAGQCRVMQSMCKQNCQLQENACRSEARADGMREYHHYVEMRRRENAKIKRSPESFMNTYQCDSSNCDDSCEDGYRGCYTDAGGQIQAQQVCVAFCDQKK